MARVLDFARAWRRDRRGVAAMEMAAVAPVLILLLVGSIDVGRATSQSIELSNAVRIGAQYAVTTPDARDKIYDATVKALPSAVKDATTVTVTCYCGVLAAGSTALPPEAACDYACPTGSQRKMKIEARHGFTPYNFAFGKTISVVFGFSQVSASVTTQQQ